MPQLPSATAALNVPQSRTGVARVDTASTVGIREQGVQSALQGIGSGLQTIQTARDTSDLANAQSQFLQAKVEQDNAYQDDKDWQTMPQRYSANVDQARQDSAQMITNPAARNQFLRDSALEVQRGTLQIGALAKQKEGDQGRANLTVGLNNNLQSASMSADSNTRAGLLNSMNGQIDAAVGKGWLDQEGGARLKVDYGNKYIAQRQSQQTTELGGKLDTIVGNATINPDLNANAAAIDKAAAQYIGVLPADQLTDMATKAKQQAFRNGLTSDNFSPDKGYQILTGQQTLDTVPRTADAGPLTQTLVSRGEFGKTGDKSPKGALGKFQMMPATARAVADQMGIPYDPVKLQFDDAYGQQLATHFVQGLLTKYNGDQVLAAAAYNAGEPAVDDWIRQHGDPRTGQTTDAQWAASIPYDETRSYVKRVANGLAQPGQAAAASPTGPNTVAQLGGDPALIPQYLDIVKAKQDRQDAQTEAQWTAQRKEVADKWSGNIASIQATGVPTLNLDDYKQAYAPDDLAVMQNEVNDAQAFNGQVQPIVSGTVQQATQSLAKLAPVAGAPDYDVQQKKYQIASGLLDQRLKGLQQDPAAYVQQNDAVAADATDQLASLDITDPEQAAEATVAINSIRMAQRRMGVPDEDIKPLTNAKAADIGNQLMTSDPAKVTALLDNVAQVYGPDGAKQVLAAKGVSPSMRFIAAADNPADAVLRNRAVMAAQTPHDDLVTGMSSKNITEKQVRDQIQSIVPAALSDRPGWDAYETGMTNTAMSLINSGMSIGDAASAVMSPWTHKYGFTDTLSIPAGPNGYDKTKVTSGLNGAVANLNQFDIDPKGGSPTALSHDWTKQQSIAALLRAHIWTNLPDDSGAVLSYDPGNTLSGIPGDPVMLANGQRLTVKFKDAQSGTFGFQGQRGQGRIGGLISAAQPVAPSRPAQPAAPITPTAPTPPIAPVAPQMPVPPTRPRAPVKPLSPDALSIPGAD